MKKVGIVGGMGPESTVDYYQQIITKFQNRVGSKEELPELFINSINMYKMFHMLHEQRLDDLIDYLTDAVQKLQVVGADFVVMSANTPHVVFEQVQENVQVPMISIVEETYLFSQELGIEKLGLLGTKFTMERDFFKKPFIAHDKTIYVPDEVDQVYIHKKVVEELEHGIVKSETKESFLTIIEQMIKKKNIEGLILGCTELPMIIKGEDVDIPLLNTAEIHVNKIVDCILL